MDKTPAAHPRSYRAARAGSMITVCTSDMESSAEGQNLFRSAPFVRHETRVRKVDLVSRTLFPKGPACRPICSPDFQVQHLQLPAQRCRMLPAQGQASVNNFSAHVCSSTVNQKATQTRRLLGRHPKQPHQHALSTGVSAAPLHDEVERVQARAACDHYASKDCHSTLLLSCREVAWHLVTDVNLQGGHLQIVGTSLPGQQRHCAALANWHCHIPRGLHQPHSAKQTALDKLVLNGCCCRQTCRRPRRLVR